MYDKWNIHADTNPNLDTNGPVAFIKRVLQGMANFSKICGKEEVSLTFEEVDKMTKVSKKRFWSHYHPTEEERQAFIREHPQEEFEEKLKHYNETRVISEKRLWNYDYQADKKKWKSIKEFSYFLIPSIAFIFYLLLNYLK